MKTNQLKVYVASTAFLLVAIATLSGCEKTSYVSGPAPMLDTTGATPVTAREPVVVPPPNSEISKTFLLDGTDNYMTVPHKLDLNVNSSESKSITFWMKTASATGTFYIVAKRPTAAPSPGYEIIMNTARIQANVRNTESKDHQTPYGTPILADDKWHHIAFVFNQTGATLSTTLYVDGISNAVSVTAPNFIPPVDLGNTLDLIVGARTNLANKFKGELDDIRIWNKPMTVQEVLTDMESKVDSTTPDLVAAWNFEDINGSSVADIKITHNGVINGPINLGQRVLKK